MTARCVRCHRPLKAPTESGMGPVCLRRAPPAPEPHERDLFGFNPEKAAAAARHRLGVHIESMVVEAHAAIRQQARAARVRAGVWAA